MSWASASVPFPRSGRATYPCPPPNAIRNGVDPCTSREFVSVPRLSNTRTTSTCPSGTAKCSGVKPSPSRAIASAPCSKCTQATADRPHRSARCGAVDTQSTRPRPGPSRRVDSRSCGLLLRGPRTMPADSRQVLSLARGDGMADVFGHSSRASAVR